MSKRIRPGRPRLTAMAIQRLKSLGCAAVGVVLIFAVGFILVQSLRDKIPYPALAAIVNLAWLTPIIGMMAGTLLQSPNARASRRWISTAIIAGPFLVLSSIPLFTHHSWVAGIASIACGLLFAAGAFTTTKNSSDYAYS